MKIPRLAYWTFFYFNSALLFSNEWALTGSGNYNTAVNWNPNTVPNSTDAVADFPSTVTTNPTTITLDISPTLGTLSFTNVNVPITISGANTFTMATSVGSPALSATTTLTGSTETFTINPNITTSQTLAVTTGPHINVI
jgi:hypothetical protein